MTKVKETFYEHRFGLFFFVFLVGFGLFFTQGFFSELGTGKTYSIYAVDFSVGFCTRLLPGAIFNLFFDELNTQTASFFYYLTLLVCYIGIAVLGEKAIKGFEEKDTSKAFIIVVIFLSLFCVNAVKGISVELLDLHWFIAVIAFIFCLYNKGLYFFIPLTFIYAVMCHNACILCYIPMGILILIYQVIACENKKEKVYLSIILLLSFLFSVGIFIYMLMFETSNLNYTIHEFYDMLKSKGVEATTYYVYPFYREVPEGAELVISPEELSKIDLIEVDTAQPKLIVLLQTVLQQIQLNMIMANHKNFIAEGMVFFPSVVFIFFMFIRRIKNNTVEKSKKLIYACSMLLFLFTQMFGFLFSTDTLRWIGHATTEIFIIFLYVALKEKDFRQDITGCMAEIPFSVLCMVVVLSATAVFY